MFPASKSRRVIIEPYCIFCGKPTDNVERHAFTKGTGETSHWYGRTVHTSYDVMPFPAHPSCYKGVFFGNKFVLIASIVCFIAFILVAFVSATGILKVNDCIMLGPLALAVLGMYGYAVGFGDKESKGNLVERYCDTHWQVDSPATDCSKTNVAFSCVSRASLTHRCRTIVGPAISGYAEERPV